MPQDLAAIFGGLWSLFLFGVSVALVVAVFQTSAATKKTAAALITTNKLLMMQMGVTEDALEPPCKTCLKKDGLAVRMVREGKQLVCPQCSGRRTT